MKNGNQDIANQKFGRLLVKHKTTQKNNSGTYFWLCQCDCGETTLSLAKDLRSGHKTSCGCYRKERAIESKKLKLKGQQFGRLLVLDETESRKKSDGKIIWKCKCDCGKEVLVNGTDLTKGNIVSCGCYHLEQHVPKLDAIRRSNLVEGTKLDMLTSKTRKDNKVGVRGVYFNKKRNKYQAYIKLQGKRKYLGSFDTIEGAKEARLRAEESMYQPILEKYQK